MPVKTPAEHRIAHIEIAAFAWPARDALRGRREGGPGAEPGERLQSHAVHVDGHIVPRPGESDHAIGRCGGDSGTDHTVGEHTAEGVGLPRAISPNRLREQRRFARGWR